MWDESSFTKHLKGRPHQIMVDGLNDKYKLKVELLRHDLRIAEQQREMELERKQRHGMKMYNQSREYCAMCDLHFYGNLISHRKNVRHQKLKAFLHPKCSHCTKEFSTRLEWDEHRLTSSHLRRVAEYRRTTKPDIKDDEFDLDDLVNPELISEGEMVCKDIDIVTKQQAEEDIIEIKEEVKEKTEGESPAKEGEEVEEGGEAMEEGDASKVEENAYNSIDLDPAKLPKYGSTLSVGLDLIKQVNGFMCRGCRKFMPTEEDYKVHVRTMDHYNNYCNLVRAKARVTARRKREEQAKERAEKGEDKDSKKDDEKEKTNNTDDEGNWKRRSKGKEDEDEEEDAGGVNNSAMEVDEGTASEEKLQIKGESVWNEVDNMLDEAPKEENVLNKVEEEEKVPIKVEEEENEEEEEVKEEEVVVTKGRNKATRGGRGGKSRRGGK
uniref:C2H2-type domain-containing protein n=2 Tax=Clastoptera arizonana TaxID=38151 RepID=A0A1B6DKI6_9HEMI